MYARERQQRPPENEPKHFMQTQPLTERSTYELQRIVGVIKSRRPRTKEGRETQARDLKSVEDELARRGVRQSTLTFKIQDVFPAGCLPKPYAQIES
jgi:hypothetical protein